MDDPKALFLLKWFIKAIAPSQFCFPFAPLLFGRGIGLTLTVDSNIFLFVCFNISLDDSHTKSLGDRKYIITKNKFILITNYSQKQIKKIEVDFQMKKICKEFQNLLRFPDSSIVDILSECLV